MTATGLSTIVATVTGEPSFAWHGDHTGECSRPVTVGREPHLGHLHIAAPCARGGNDQITYRLGLGAQLAHLAAGDRVWAQGHVTAQPLRLAALRLRPQRRDVAWSGHLQLAGTVTAARGDGRVTVELHDGSRLHVMLPLDTAIAAGEAIRARVLPAPKGRLPRLRNIALDPQ